MKKLLFILSLLLSMIAFSQGGKNITVLLTHPVVTEEPDSDDPALNFFPVVSLSSTDEIWSGTNNTGGSGQYLNYGLATKKLSAGEDGSIQCKWQATDASSVILAFNTSQANQPYWSGSYASTNYEAGFFVSSAGVVFRIDNAAIATTGVTIASGEFLKIDRTSGVLKLQRSTNETSWTDVYTYTTFNATASANNDLFININIDQLNKCYFPKGENLDFISAASTLANANIIADGNSYVQGNGYTPFPTVLMTLSPFSSNGSTMLNYGVGGQTTPDMVADQATQILTKYTAGKANILIVYEGGNDIHFNGSVTNAVANMKTYCQNARAAGFKVILITQIHRDHATAFGDNSVQYNAKLDQLNALYVGDDTFYDRIVRPDLDPLFQTYTSGGYDADKTHLNQTGQNKLAELISTSIQSLY